MTTIQSGFVFLAAASIGAVPLHADSTSIFSSGLTPGQCMIGYNEQCLPAGQTQATAPPIVPLAPAPTSLPSNCSDPAAGKTALKQLQSDYAAANTAKEANEASGSAVQLALVNCINSGATGCAPIAGAAGTPTTPTNAAAITAWNNDEVALFKACNPSPTIAQARAFCRSEVTIGGCPPAILASAAPTSGPCAQAAALLANPSLGSGTGGGAASVEAARHQLSIACRASMGTSSGAPARAQNTNARP